MASQRSSLITRWRLRFHLRGGEAASILDSKAGSHLASQRRWGLPGPIRRGRGGFEGGFEAERVPQGLDLLLQLKDPQLHICDLLILGCHLALFPCELSGIRGLYFLELLTS